MKRYKNFYNCQKDISIEIFRTQQEAIMRIRKKNWMVESINTRIILLYDATNRCSSQGTKAGTRISRTQIVIEKYITTVIRR